MRLYHFQSITHYLCVVFVCSPHKVTSPFDTAILPTFTLFDLFLPLSPLVTTVWLSVIMKLWFGLVVCCFLFYIPRKSEIAWFLFFCCCCSSDLCPLARYSQDPPMLLQTSGFQLFLQLSSDPRCRLHHIFVTQLPTAGHLVVSPSRPPPIMLH